MSRLLRIDDRIHSLKRELKGPHGPRVTNYELAAKRDELAEAYVSRSHYTNRLECLAKARQQYDEAIRLGQHAIQAASDNDAKGRCWFFQASRLRSYWDLFGTDESEDEDDSDDTETLDLLNRVIDTYAYAIAFLPSGSRLRAEAAHNRANMLAERYEITRQSTDLDEAIANGNEALAIAGQRPNSSSYGSILNDVSLRYLARWDLYGHEQDLHTAAELGFRATQDSRCDPPKRIERLLNLSSARKALYERYGHANQLEAAHTELGRAHHLAERNAPNLRPQVLARLAITKLHVSTLRQNPQLQSEAIQLAVQALRLASSDDLLDTRDELIRMIASAVARIDPAGRTTDELAQLIAGGQNPLEGS